MKSAPSTLLGEMVACGDHTLEEIVEGFERCARTMGENATLSPRTLRRWMVGDLKSAPRPAQRRVAARYWGVPMEQLLAPAPSGQLPVRTLATDDESVGGMESSWSRRSAGYDRHVLSEELIVMSARRAARFTTAVSARNVSPETLDQLHDDLGGLARAYLRQPLSGLIGDLVRTQDDVFALLEGSRKPSYTRQLYVLAGVASGLVAKASHDLIRPREAMAHARTMYVCGDNADHDPVRAWARGLQSLIAYWAGRTGEAARYAQAGVDIASGLRGSVAIWLAALQARALAELGEERAARAALARAVDGWDRYDADDLDILGGLMTFPVARQHYYAAGAYVVFRGEALKSADEARTALTLYEGGAKEDRSFSDEAGARAELARAYLVAGDLDGVRDALGPILRLPPECRIGGVLASVRRVYDGLGGSAHRDAGLARDLREEIEAFVRLPASVLVG